ncbi:glutathione S-transferase family protein [Tsuneonella flava]|uniref:Glutathione S-transferase family protein n=1 Tax=Tsuneonella flava TaxID=2055955 RepID=A0ABX7KDV4_9SPHN|nr:glutathione S-transferase family protein [Tsuneonella flava]QSB46093.1 glutathione S-transferase family protein [Tsuneonella flava]
MIDPAAELEITAFEWVPKFAQGYVRDLRLRWACEEAKLPYSERLISAVKRPEWYFSEQPWGQVPVLRDGEITVFESGACLMHLGEKSETLLPRDPAVRAPVVSWLFAALNSLEPMAFEMARVAFFSADEKWAPLRRPSLEKQIAGRLAPVERHMAANNWIAGVFSIADIAMVTVLRDLASNIPLDPYPALSAYLERGVGRPAFAQAMADQLAPFARNAPPE